MAFNEGGNSNYVAPEPNQMFTLGHEKWKRAGPTPLQSTAGAVEVRDAKGRIVGMEKVKVTRYMTGKRPDWAPEEFDSDEELTIQTKSIKIKEGLLFLEFKGGLYRRARFPIFLLQK